MIIFSVETNHITKILNKIYKTFQKGADKWERARYTTSKLIMEVVDMFNKNENMLSALSTLFECREENLYALTNEDKEKIKNLTKNNDNYEKLFSIIENLSPNIQNIEKVKNSLDSYIDKINIIGAYENEKFYKIRIFRCNKFNIRMCLL